MSQEYNGDITHHYETRLYVTMTLNLMPLEHTGLFVTRTHARDHGINSLSFLLEPMIDDGISENHLKTNLYNFCHWSSEFI